MAGSLKVAWGLNAPADGATVKGLVFFAATGVGMANLDLTQAGKFDPKYGQVVLNLTGTLGLILLDTTKLADGDYSMQLVAYDKPAGQAADVTRSAKRKWVIRNSVIAVPPPRIDLPSTAEQAPLILSDAPRGYSLVEDESWWNYKLGPVASFDMNLQPRFSHNADTLNGSAEGQVYVTPKVKAAGVKYNPFSIQNVDGLRCLAITPKLVSATEREILTRLGYGDKDYLSGVVSSLHEQTYGYYETYVKLPTFLGAWSAIWTMGPDQFPEFDHLEHLPRTHGDQMMWAAVHYHGGGGGNDIPLDVKVDQWFKVGALWHPNFVAVYANDRLVWEDINPPERPAVGGLHEPAHRVFNLALGGRDPNSWPGPVRDLSAMTPMYVGPWRTFKAP